jgi:hypothetical protein
MLNQEFKFDKQAQLHSVRMHTINLFPRFRSNAKRIFVDFDFQFVTTA